MIMDHKKSISEDEVSAGDLKQMAADKHGEASKTYDDAVADEGDLEALKAHLEMAIK
jgi:hypothetical protein